MTLPEDSATVNRNLLSPLGYKLVLKRAPNVEFWCQKFPIPGDRARRRDVSHAAH